jgi:hypothetical protein
MRKPYIGKESLPPGPKQEYRELPALIVNGFEKVVYEIPKLIDAQSGGKTEQCPAQSSAGTRASVETRRSIPRSLSELARLRTPCFVGLLGVSCVTGILKLIECPGSHFAENR